MKLITSFALVLSLVGLVGLAGIAHADDAAEHFAKGTRAYNVQDWANALKEYKEAYELDPKPDTLWAIAQTERLSGDCRGAILSYKAYMRSASPAGANAAMDWIKSCEADLDAQRRAVESAVTEPAPEPKPTPKPTPRSTSTAPSAPPPEPTPTAPPTIAIRSAPPSERSRSSDPLADTLLIAGLGGLAVGTTFFAIGAVDAGHAPQKATVGDWHREATTASTDQGIGIAVGAAGAVCLGLAIWRFASGHDREAPSVTIAPTAGGAFATYRASF